MTPSFRGWNGSTGCRKKKPDLTPEEQFNRLQEAAKEHEIEKQLPKIEWAFESLAKHKNKRVEKE